MKIVYSKDSLNILAWDSDFTKVTNEEREQIQRAEDSGFICEDEVDWDNLGKYAA